MKGYSIYRDNTVIYEFVVDDTISKSLSGNKYVSFTISSKNDLDLKIGDYVLVGNEKYEIFGPIDIEESNGVFTYPLTFYFQGYKLNNSIITDEGATTFAYHGEVSDFMTLLIDSLNEDYPEFTLGTIQNGSILDLSFDNSNCMAALQTVCENAEMEWDITGTVITVKRRIGEETDYVFEYGKNKGSYSVKLAKVANASVTTRMIGKGGTLNLPADYDSPDSPKRLNLGDEVIEKNVEKYGKITGVYVNENIYPRLINKTVLGVTVPENIEEAGSWKIKLDIPFNLSEYYAENEIPVVKFQTGDLTGLNFEIVENSWNNTDKTLSIIVKEEEDGYYLPNANRQPRVGDVFVLLNINMPQSYIDEATQELREATQNELNKKCEPQYAPSLSVQKHYIKKKGISLNIGDGITVKIGRRNITTRIIGTTETSDDIRVELGDQMLYTYDTKVNNTIEQIQFTLKQLINIDDIKRLFYNLINAWYPKWFNQKLHKDADVEFNSVKAAELVQSDNFSSKNFTSGALGSGHRIKDGNAEFQNLTVRGQFSVFEFLIQQVKAIGGKFCVSPAAIKTESVEETENGYKCFFNTDSGTIINPFVVGDQAFHQVFDGQKMKRYWRLVTEVGADYFVLSKTDCEANSGIPEADEEIVLLGNRTDINRQSAIMISAYDNNSPYIAFYAGINSYSFEGKEPMRTGNLNGIVDEDFGQLTGFGLYCQNVYMKGVFRLMSGKTVEESIGDVQSNLDNLQIGGRNLLIGSSNGRGWSYGKYEDGVFYRETGTTENHIVSQRNLSFIQAEEYTISFDYKSDNMISMDVWFLKYESTTRIYVDYEVVGSSEWKHYTRTFKALISTEVGYLRIDNNGAATGTAKLWVKNIMLEKGNKATSWSPAPEDTEYAISEAKQAAEIAQTTAAEATSKLNNWASDSLISPPEKSAMKQQQADIQAEYKEIKANAEKYGLTSNAAWTNYNSAYSLANSALTKYTASSPENITISSDYSNIAAYYPKRQEILNAISSAAKQSADNAQNTANNAQSAASAAQDSVMQVTAQVADLVLDNNGLKLSVKETSEKVDKVKTDSEESIKQVQNNLDNLQVGETNLLDNSNKGWKNTGYPIATIYLGDYKPKQGEECTIVIKGKLGANKTNWAVYNSGGNVVLASFYPGGPDTDYIALKTFKWTLGTPAVDNTFIRIYPMPNSVSVESEIEWVKLVLGNKTSLLWTPSINDQRQIAIDEAGKVVDGIQIGGVNILIGSTTGTGWTGYTEHKDTEFSIKDASTIESYIRSARITIPGNKEIVVSFYAKHTGHQNYFDFYILPDSYPEIDALLTSSYQSGTDWTYNEFKFTTPSDWGEGTLVYLRIDHNGMSDGSEFIIYVKDVQIEYGNKATTYSVPESDRKEAIDAKTYRETEIDLRAEKWDQDTYYPVTIRIPTYETMIEVTAMWGASKPEWATHESGFSMNCVWRSNGSGWGVFTIKRTIEVFEYRFTEQNIHPAGSIGQLTSSSEELIYLRGGGRYTFRIGNNCVAVVHDSRYTAPDGSSVAPAASVIRPVLTNATKEELNAEINITKGLIENKVSLDVYNENDQLIKSDISNLQVSYNQISSTVSKIINGTQEISGVVTQSNFVTIFSSNKNALGQEVIESINVGGGGVTIDASRINLNGAISANGNVQITTDGKLIAVNGEFTGKITATEGEIAGLKLSNNGLRSSDFNASSKIGSCYAKNGFSVYASGSGVLKPSTGGMQAGIITAVGDFISHITGLEIIAKETSYNYGSSSKVTALRIQAENRYYGTPFDPPLAIEVVSGDVLFGGKMTVNNTSIFRGQIYLNLNNIPNISGASNYYLCINRSTGRLSYR